MAACSRPMSFLKKKINRGSIGGSVCFFENIMFDICAYMVCFIFVSRPILLVWVQKVVSPEVILGG